MKVATAWFWLNIVAASTLVFWLSSWDITIAQFFYDPATGAKHWFLDDYPVWRSIFYDGVPYLAGIILVGSLLFTAVSTVLKRWYRLRLYAIYLLLVFIIGPGLLVNSLFKDHWGRARPMQVLELGGTEQYTPPLYYVANGHGRSFPSGHSSVGFAFIAFWFLLRKRKPLLGKVALVSSLLLGIIIGLTRMAAGGHFLSDVMWSAWIPLFVAWLLYYPLLRIPAREQRYEDALRVA